MTRKIFPHILYELSLIFKKDAPASRILGRLILETLGFQFNEIVEGQEHHRPVLKVFVASNQDAQRLKKQLVALSLKAITIEITELKRPDWQDRWKRDFAPFALTQTLDVVPVWRKKDYKPKIGRQPILIDTISAFGTGLHDTTRFMAELIEEYAQVDHRLLDVGTGTGILAMVALKLGVKNVSAIDIDPECITVATANLKRNRLEVTELKAIDIAKIKIKNEFDFVVANLISHDLVQLKENLKRLVVPGGVLAISGISLENSAWVDREFKKISFQRQKVKKSKAWVAFLYKNI